MENIPEMMVISSLVFLVIRRLTMSLKQREYLFIQVVIKLESSLSQDTVATCSINWFKKWLSAVFVGERSDRAARWPNPEELLDRGSVPHSPPGYTFPCTPAVGSLKAEGTVLWWLGWPSTAVLLFCSAEARSLCSPVRCSPRDLGFASGHREHSPGSAVTHFLVQNVEFLPNAFSFTEIWPSTMFNSNAFLTLHIYSLLGRQHFCMPFWSISSFTGTELKGRGDQRGGDTRKIHKIAFEAFSLSRISALCRGTDKYMDYKIKCVHQII